MGRAIHFVPGLADPCSGIAVVARKIAEAQAAQLADASEADASMVAGFDEVWVHSTWTPAVWRASWAAVREGKRLVRMTHGNLDPVRRRFSRWKKLLAGPFERRSLRCASKIVATCKAEASWIEGYLGADCPPVEVVDLRKYDWGRGTKGQSACPAPGKPRTAPLRVLYMGRRHSLKGLQYLEKAVSEANSDAAGDSKHWNLGLTCFPMFELRIVTAAHGAEKEAAFDWCDVFCLPTLSENFGIVVAEALQRGKPVITTDGAPAWADEPRVGPDGKTRLVYLEGYRDASPDDRVRMLKEVLERFCAKQKGSDHA